jgi:hypothetical protein
MATVSEAWPPAAKAMDAMQQNTATTANNFFIKIPPLVFS